MACSYLYYPANGPIQDKNNKKQQHWRHVKHCFRVIKHTLGQGEAKRCFGARCGFYDDVLT